jgi:hypothetical protein
MDLKKKILIVIASCAVLCAGTFVIIYSMFAKLEAQFIEESRMHALIGSRVSSTMLYVLYMSGAFKGDVASPVYEKTAGTTEIFKTTNDELFQKHLQKIAELSLVDSDVSFVIMTDQNGLVHVSTRKKGSKKTIGGKFSVDNIKNKFITEDPEIKNLIAFRGSGTISMHEKAYNGENACIIAAPILLKDRHWGSFIIGLSMARSDAMKNQMILLIVAFMFVILSITILAVLAVIPRRYLPGDMRP